MSRFAVPLLAVISLSCSSAIAPETGSIDAPSGHDAHHIDAPDPVTDAPSDTTATSDAAFACKPPNIIHGDGKHNAGMDCMDSCHSHGFSVAGTVMMPDGVTPANNATVTVVDANNFSQDAVIGNNGNFFSYLPVAYPITITTSMCPSVQTMVEQATAGGCNAMGCHEPGGLQGPVHL